MCALHPLFTDSVDNSGGLALAFGWGAVGERGMLIAVGPLPLGRAAVQAAVENPPAVMRLQFVECHARQIRL